MIEIVDTPLEGRHVVSAKSIPAGAVIHVSHPYVLSIAPECSRYVCVGCLKPLDRPIAALTTSAHDDEEGKIKKSNPKGKMKSDSYHAMKQQLAIQKKKAAASSGSNAKRTEECSTATDVGSASEERTCRGCGLVAYCSAACEASHAPVHKADLECLANRLVHSNSKHRTPQEVHFLAVILQVVLKCAAQGFASRLVLPDAADPISTEALSGNNSSSNATPTTPSVSAARFGPSSSSAADGVAPQSSHSTGKEPSDEESVASSSSTTAAHSSAQQRRSVAGCSGTIPADALRVRQTVMRRGIETVDRESHFDVQRENELLRDSSSATAPASSLSLLPQWRDLGQLVTNVSTIGKDHLSDFHTLHRFFLKVIRDCPGSIFGLPPLASSAEVETTKSGNSAGSTPAVESCLPDLLADRRCAPQSDTFSDGVGGGGGGASTADRVGDRQVITSGMFYRLCAALQCNGFGVYTYTDRCKAIGFYPHASYFNHSCVPNICRVMEGRLATFYALHDIPTGTPCCISYTDIEKETAERRHTLLATYRFFCECSRCSGSATLPYDRCTQCAARGYLRPTERVDDRAVEVECSVCRCKSRPSQPRLVTVQEHEERKREK